MRRWSESLSRCIDAMATELVYVRRHLHMHPEPSGEEYNTTRFVAQRLEQAGIAFRVVPSGRGIIADGSDATLPRIAMRADMDALNITEESEMEYRSTKPGLMHACGHDAHTTMVLGAALALERVQKELPWPCPWRAVFQPAEETARGALEMVAAGAVKDTKSIIALHVDPEVPAGHVSLRPGELTACCQDLDIIIHGHGGHAARPHQSRDPIAAAVHFISNVYQTIPRSVDSRDPVVVTFGVIQGGDNENVIPERVLLRGTIRTLTKRSTLEVERVLDRIRRGTSEITGTMIEMKITTGPGAVYNDENITAVMWQAAADVVGADHVHHIPQPSMGAEDFAGYLVEVPGCLLRLGVAREGQPKHFLHSPRFDIDESSLMIGAKILAHTLVLLSRPPT